MLRKTLRSAFSSRKFVQLRFGVSENLIKSADRSEPNNSSVFPSLSGADRAPKSVEFKRRFIPANLIRRLWHKWQAMVERMADRGEFRGKEWHIEGEMGNGGRLRQMPQDCVNGGRLWLRAKDCVYGRRLWLMAENCG